MHSEDVNTYVHNAHTFLSCLLYPWYVTRQEAELERHLSLMVSEHAYFGVEGQLIAAPNIVSIGRAPTRCTTTDDTTILLVAATVRAPVSTAQDHL